MRIVAVFVLAVCSLTSGIYLAFDVAVPTWFAAVIGAGSCVATLTGLLVLLDLALKESRPHDHTETSVDFLPEGMSVVLSGTWRIEVSEGLRAVVATKIGGLEVVPWDGAYFINHGDLCIYGIGADLALEEGPQWAPWWMMAVVAGALAPHILDVMNGEPLDDEDS
jgi:hypothetical protein